MCTQYHKNTAAQTLEQKQNLNKIAIMQLVRCISTVEGWLCLVPNDTQRWNYIQFKPYKWFCLLYWANSTFGALFCSIVLNISALFLCFAITQDITVEINPKLAYWCQITSVGDVPLVLLLPTACHTTVHSWSHFLMVTASLSSCTTD